MEERQQATGTTLVEDIRVNYGSHPRYLTNVNGTLFFAASGGSAGYGLWKSDGTTAGTVMVKGSVYFWAEQFVLRFQCSIVRAAAKFAECRRHAVLFCSGNGGRQLRALEKRWNVRGDGAGQRDPPRNWFQRLQSSTSTLSSTTCSSSPRMTAPMASNCGRAMTRPRGRRCSRTRHRRFRRAWLRFIRQLDSVRVVHACRRRVVFRRQRRLWSRAMEDRRHVQRNDTGD